MCEKKNDNSIPNGTNYTICGDISEMDPPVPISNTEVKHLSAENTCLAEDREDRSLPHFHYTNNCPPIVGVFLFTRKYI